MISTLSRSVPAPADLVVGAASWPGSRRFSVGRSVATWLGPSFASGWRGATDNPAPVSGLNGGRAGASEVSADGLATWLLELRARLERGDLTDLAPIDLGRGKTLASVELGVARMLDQVDAYATMPESERRQPWNVARRRMLAS